MPSNLYSFADLLQRYRQLLVQNPGKALVLGTNLVAILDGVGSVCGSVFNQRTGVIDHCLKFQFDERSFQDGHWLSETVVETNAAVSSPKLIDLSFLPTGRDPILGYLPSRLLRLVEDSLSNDDVTPHDELLANLIENRLSGAQAARALDFRSRYRWRIYRMDATPILLGDDAEHFDPRTSKFVRDGG